MASATASAKMNSLACRPIRPARARNVYVRLPKNCTEAPARSAGSRALVGASPTTRMHVVSTEKSTIVAPLPTTRARTKRKNRATRGSGRFKRLPSGRFCSAVCRTDFSRLGQEIRNEDHALGLRRFVPDLEDRHLGRAFRALDEGGVAGALTEKRLGHRRCNADLAGREVDLVGAHDAVRHLRAVFVFDGEPGAEEDLAALLFRGMDDVDGVEPLAQKANAAVDLAKFSLAVDVLGVFAA